MTDLAGIHSYFWLTSSRLREPVQDEVPYTAQGMRQDLLRVRHAWEECQSSRDRNAIYGYLTAVFDLVAWWAAEDRAISRARWALQLQHLDLPITDEPFAAVILCTSDRKKVDKRTRSKWSRVLRYAAEYKILPVSGRRDMVARVPARHGVLVEERTADDGHPSCNNGGNRYAEARSLTVAPDISGQFPPLSVFVRGPSVKP
jgi:hypothetical protein